MHNEHIRFEVQDDGKGFNSDSTEPHGYGLRNMAARAQELGAGFLGHFRNRKGHANRA